MKRTIVVCDSCGEKDLKNHHDHSLEIRDSIDPVDGRTSADYQAIDLCSRCSHDILARVFRLLTNEQRQAVITRFKSPKTNNKKTTHEAVHP